MNPNPPDVFGSVPVDARLIRWEAPTQSLCTYDEWMPEEFGNMLVGDGYWLRATAAGRVSYPALDDLDSMDIRVSLPKAGWSIIGNPFSYNFPWESAKVTDGIETISLTEARTRLWLNSIGLWWNSDTQSLCEVGMPDDYAISNQLLPWHGYWVHVTKDSIALILESQQ